jgi:hypothetical protein
LAATGGMIVGAGSAVPNAATKARRGETMHFMRFVID